MRGPPPHKPDLLRAPAGAVLLGCALCLCAACSTLVYRRGQSTLIGEPQPGTPTHAVLTNREGEPFRVPRRDITLVRYGGQRTALWSALTFDGIIIGGPIGAYMWFNEVAAFTASNGPFAQAAEVPAEEEVVPPEEASP